MRLRKTMPLEAAIAARLRTVVALMLVAPALLAADSASTAPIAVDAIVFKENGRFDPKIVAECGIEEELRDAMNQALRRKASRRSATAEPWHVTLRIDKIGNLGSVGQAGTELGVTAIWAGHDTGRLIVCRDRVSPFRPTHCGRIAHCARQIADDVVAWVAKQSTDKTRK
jgi:hypothetical protein